MVSIVLTGTNHNCDFLHVLINGKKIGFELFFRTIKAWRKDLDNFGDSQFQEPQCFHRWKHLPVSWVGKLDETEIGSNLHSSSVVLGPCVPDLQDDRQYSTVSLSCTNHMQT